MAQREEESEYLRKLRAIQDSVDWDKIYRDAQFDLEMQLMRRPGKRKFHVCVGASEEVIKYIAQRFVEDGLEAKRYNGDDVIAACVSVIIPAIGGV